MLTMWLSLLAFYERASLFIKYYVDSTKSYARYYLGPEPVNYYLFRDGRVIPTYVHVPADIDCFLYDAATQQITERANPNPAGRFRALPYLGLSVGTLDISDWVGGIRANPVFAFRPKQLVELWSLVHNTYVNLNVSIQVVHGDGTEEIIRGSEEPAEEDLGPNPFEEVD
jgi:hypothetical protein